MILATLLLSACSNPPEIAGKRQWLAERTNNFLGIYKVAYEKVYTLQSKEHPCTRGHKAEPAAIFHATLMMLNKAYMDYQKEVDSKLDAQEKLDPPIKDMLTVVDQIVKPFAEMSHVNQCGKLSAGEASQQFYIQTPLEAQQAVGQLQSRVNEDIQAG
jgi:soluble cytochrome b562